MPGSSWHPPPAALSCSSFSQLLPQLSTPHCQLWGCFLAQGTGEVGGRGVGKEPGRHRTALRKQGAQAVGAPPRSPHGPWLSHLALLQAHTRGLCPARARLQELPLTLAPALPSWQPRSPWGPPRPRPPRADSPCSWADPGTQAPHFPPSQGCRSSCPSPQDAPPPEPGTTGAGSCESSDSAHGSLWGRVPCLGTSFGPHHNPVGHGCSPFTGQESWDT